MAFKINIPSVVGIISAVLAMFSVTLVWFTASSAKGFFIGTGTQITGWEIFSAVGSGAFSSAFIVPLAVVGFGFSLLALSLLGCLSMYNQLDKRMLSIPMIVIGLLFIALYVFLYNDYTAQAAEFGVTLTVEFGMYLVLLAGVGGIAAGALRQMTQIREE